MPTLSQSVTLCAIAALTSAAAACGDDTEVGIYRATQDSRVGWLGGCSLVANDGSQIAGAYGGYGWSEEHHMQNGTLEVIYWADDESAEPLLSFSLELDSFPPGSARFESFKTPEGATHQVYVWAESDCESPLNGPPNWVLEETAGK